MIALDYSKCEKEGEPQVVWIAQEDDYYKHFLAKDFETFISLLRDAELMEEFNELTKEIEEKLFELLLKYMKEITIEKEIYCLNISYGSESNNIIPPFFSFGESYQREEWRKNIPKKIEWYLWNFAEYGVEEYELSLDSQTRKLFDRYNQIATELRLWDIQIRTVLNVTKRLKKHISKFNWNKSDDFVVIATDLEQVDVEKNFEFLGK